MAELQRIALEVGSHQYKIGITGDDAPRSVERPFYMEEIDPKSGKTTLVPQPNRYLNPNIKSYFDQSYLYDWDAAEQIWSHDMDLLMGDQQYGLLMTAKPNASSSSLVRQCEFAFESNPNVMNFGISGDNTLALYASGRTTGLTIDFGYFETRVGAYHEGYPIPGSMRVWNIGSVHSSALVKFIANAVSDLFREQPQKDFLVEGIKRKLANRVGNAIYELPDGNILEFGTNLEDIFRYITEGIVVSEQNAWAKSLKHKKYQEFEGSNIELRQLVVEEGIPRHNLASLVNSILFGTRDEIIRRELAANIVIAGGGSMPMDDTQRLVGDLNLDYASRLLTESMVPRFKIIAPPERLFSTWIGASILGSLTTYEDLTFTRETYEEMGPLHMLHNKSAHGF